MTWSRRQLLSVLAAGAAAPTLAPLLHGCGGAQTGSARRRQQARQRALDEITDQVRDAVGRLARNFGEASGYVRRSRHGNALVDGAEKHVDAYTHTELVLRAVAPGGNWFERATSDLSSDGINLAELQLRQRGTPTSAAPVPATGQPRTLTSPRHTTQMIADPRSQAPQQWLTATEALHRRARAAGDSRIVYRGAYLMIDDSDSVFITPDAQVTQRIVRTRAGVHFVAWTGNAVSLDEASRAGTMGMEALRISDAELRAAARRALSLLTARGSRDFDTQVVLAPSVVAMLAHRCVAPALSADHWQSGESDARRRLGKRLGSPLVTVIDDPTRRGFYGSYVLDDEGQPAQRTTLIKAGVLTAPLTNRAAAATLRLRGGANGRRASLLEPARPLPSNLWFEPGTSSHDQLIASVNDGVLVEGALHAELDPRSWRLVIRAARAHEIRNGSLSGKLFAGVDLIAELPALLGAVTQMSNQVVHRPASDAPATSAGGPYMLTRASLVGRA